MGFGFRTGGGAVLSDSLVVTILYLWLHVVSGLMFSCAFVRIVCVRACRMVKLQRQRAWISMPKARREDLPFLSGSHSLPPARLLKSL